MVAGCVTATLRRMVPPDPTGTAPRVLHVIASLAVGGTERQLVEFIRRSSSPHAHLVALFDEPGALAADVPSEPVMLGRVSRRLRDVSQNLNVVRSLRRLVRVSGVELVHAHLDLSELLAAAATPRSVPIVASRRGLNVRVGEHGAWRVAEGLAHRRVSRMICNSNYLAERTRRRDLWPPPIEVIHNGIDVDRFSPVPLPSGPPVIAVVANFHEYKRHDRFLHALSLATAPARTSDVRAILVGGGRTRAAAEALVAELGLSARVEFAGQVADTRPLVSRAHIVALTSDHEGFPNVVLEAMAMGRPVVATAVGGIPEIVRDGVDGLLVSPTPPAVASALGRLLGDRSLIESMGAQAVHRAKTFSWDRVVRDTEAVYARVLNASPD